MGAQHTAAVARILETTTTKSVTVQALGPKIEKLFAPPALYATLAVFFDYPDDTLYPRLISRLTGTDIKSVLRELAKLKEIGILSGGPGGRGKDYWLNTDLPLYGELVAIFAKTRKSRR